MVKKYVHLKEYKNRYSTIYDAKAVGVFVFGGGSNERGLDADSLLIEKTEVDNAIKRLPRFLKVLALLRFMYDVPYDILCLGFDLSPDGLRDCFTEIERRMNADDVQ